MANTERSDSAWKRAVLQRLGDAGQHQAHCRACAAALVGGQHRRAGHRERCCACVSSPRQIARSCASEVIPGARTPAACRLKRRLATSLRQAEDQRAIAAAESEVVAHGVAQLCRAGPGHQVERQRGILGLRSWPWAAAPAAPAPVWSRWLRRYRPRPGVWPVTPLVEDTGTPCGPNTAAQRRRLRAIIGRRGGAVRIDVADVLRPQSAQAASAMPHRVPARPRPPGAAWTCAMRHWTRRPRRSTPLPATARAARIPPPRRSRCRCGRRRRAGRCLATAAAMNQSHAAWTGTGCRPRRRRRHRSGPLRSSAAPVRNTLALDEQAVDITAIGPLQAEHFGAEAAQSHRRHGCGDSRSRPASGPSHDAAHTRPRYRGCPMCWCRAPARRDARRGWLSRDASTPAGTRHPAAPAMPGGGCGSPMRCR